MIEKLNPKTSTQEVLIIVCISVILAFIYNLFSPKSIPWIKSKEIITYVSNEELFQKRISDSLSQKNVTTQQLLGLIETKIGIIIDARNKDAYIRGHIPGAINIPFLDVFNYVEQLDIIPRDTLIVVYCEGVNCELSHHLSEFMLNMNFSRIYHYIGGYEEWVSKNLPLEKEE